MLPIGAIEEIEKKNDNVEMEIMDKLWKMLTNRVEEKNNNQLAIADDKHVNEILETLRMHSDESHRLSNMLSDENTSKIKKGSTKIFAVGNSKQMSK